MSGHSKFANIKHKKEKNDAAKGKIFTKIGKELAVAVKEGGSADPANNSRLRDVIAKVGSFALFILDVIAAQITVGLCRLPTSFWMISTGRTPPCSDPTTGLRSA